MYKKMVLKKLFKFMLASGMAFTVVSPATAAPSYPGHYWVPANILPAPPQYHFRPLPQQAYPVAPRDYRFTRQQRIPAYPGRHGFPTRPAAPVAMAATVYQPWQLRVRAMRPTAQMMPPAYPVTSSGLPAFARQFGWMRNVQAGRHSFGASINRYANQTTGANPVMAMTTVPARMSAAQYRYRPDNRNSVRRVQFTDSFRSAGVMPHAAYQWQDSSVGRRFQTAQVDNNPYQMRQAFLARQQSRNSTQQYRFRPDPRFKVENKAEISERNNVLPVSYKLANNYNPDFNSKASNPWKQWSFRPVDTTF